MEQEYNRWEYSGGEELEAVQPESEIKLAVSEDAHKTRGTGQIPDVTKRHKSPWLGKLDRYLIKTFLGTFVFSIVLILSIAIVFDINEKINDFLKPEVSLYEIVFHYYLNFIPYYANLFSPLFVFISVIFFTTKLADNSEIIAMLASGMSFRRLLRPYLVAATVIAGVTFVLNNYIIPPSTKQRQVFENAYVKNKKIEYAESVQLEVEKDVFMYIRTFNAVDKTGYDFSLDRFEGRDLRSRLTADRAYYDTLGRWRLYNYRLRDFDGLREIDRVGGEMDSVIPIAPSDFLVTAKDVETMTSPQLSEYVHRQSERGVDNAKLFAIELHRRYAAVFSAFILTFIGAVLSAKKVKNGMGVNIAIGIGLCAGYILFSTVSTTFANSGAMPAWLAAWLPNFVFVLLALLLWRKAPK